MYVFPYKIFARLSVYPKVLFRVSKTAPREHTSQHCRELACGNEDYSVLTRPAAFNSSVSGAVVYPSIFTSHSLNPRMLSMHGSPVVLVIMATRKFRASRDRVRSQYRCTVNAPQTTTEAIFRRMLETQNYIGHARERRYLSIPRYFKRVKRHSRDSRDFNYIIRYTL